MDVAWTGVPIERLPDFLTKVKLGKPTIKPSVSHQYEKSRSCLSYSGPAFSPEDNIKMKEIAGKIQMR
jgi:hypothetical protein